MAFTTINPAAILPGEPVTSDLFTDIKDNFDDHEARLVALATGSAKVELMNEKIFIGANSTAQLTGFHDKEILQAGIVVEGSIQLYLKAPATTGSITLDVKKNTTTNPAGFNSIFTVLPTLNVATAADYQKASGTINPTYQTLAVGDILRLDITSLPVGLQYIRITLIGEI